MKRTFKTLINQNGFTLIEIVVVLIVLAIFIAVVSVSHISISTDEPNEIEILKSSLRFAQIKALNDAVDDDTWGISFTSGASSYTLINTVNSIAGSPINLPGECGPSGLTCIPSATHNLPAGMTITGSTVNFNKWGSPGAVDATVVLNKDGSAVATIKVTKNTGYILIQ